MKKKKRRSSR